MDLKKNFWKETYKRNIKKMIGISYRYVSDRQIAEDLAHDSFINAIKKSDTFKSKGHFDAWLRKITINTALQHLRDIKVKNENQQEFILQELINNDEEMDKWQDFTIHELFETINKLPEHHRLVFNLYVLDNYSHKQISILLNISEGTSKSHLARARKKLQQILNEKLQKKENKRSFILILFPYGFGKIDRLFKNKLSDYEIEPQSTLSFDKFNWNNINVPIFKTFYNFTIKIIALGLTAILITTVMFNKKDQPNSPIEKNIILTSDTLAPLKIIETVSINPDTISEIKTTQNQTPVIVSKKRITRKTVIIKDTLKILDANAK